MTAAARGWGLDRERQVPPRPRSAAVHTHETQEAPHAVTPPRRHGSPRTTRKVTPLQPPSPNVKRPQNEARQPRTPIQVLLTDVATVYDVPAGTLRRWVSEGRLTPLRRRPCYVDLDQAMDLIGRMRPSRGQR